jgi:hypothetical protein
MIYECKRDVMLTIAMYRLVGTIWTREEAECHHTESRKTALRYQQYTKTYIMKSDWIQEVVQ